MLGSANRGPGHPSGPVTPNRPSPCCRSHWMIADAPNVRVFDNRTPRWDNGASRASYNTDKHRGGRHDSLSRKVRGLQAGLPAGGR